MLSNEASPRISEHAISRAQTTLARLFDAEAERNTKAINLRNYQNGKYYIVVKKFSKVEHIDQDNRNGDCLVAVVNRGTMVTIMLTKSWRKDYFARDGKLIQ